MWLDSEDETHDSEYLISSRARSLMQRLARSLETVGIDVSPKRPAHGTGYLTAFAEAIDSLLAMMGSGK